ncbi:MAG: alpha/beta hydrolase [Alphaproteobacteria bacterium]|nr:alpha/beta hydrolase [Alphaproteobacteria bacterium]
MTDFSRRQLVQIMAGAAVFGAAPALAANGIDESGFVQIGGIDQWIAIQGQDRANPVILYLHGGPGEAQSPFLDQFKPWERDFTVVNWDQRGAGKTYEKNGGMPAFNLDRVVDDAIELAEYVRKTLGKPKLVLVGQSTGSLLGLKVAQRRPDLFYAYVGTAQFVSVIRNSEWQETQTDVPHSHDGAEMKALHQWAAKAPPDQPYIAILDRYTGPEDHPNPAGAKWFAGYRFEARNIGKEMSEFDAMRDVPALAVPYIVIQGRDDRMTPAAVTKAYFDKVQSKGKAYAVIEGGHFACFTNPKEFVAALRLHLRHLV